MTGAQGARFAPADQQSTLQATRHVGLAQPLIKSEVAALQFDTSRACTGSDPQGATSVIRWQGDAVPLLRRGCALAESALPEKRTSAGRSPSGTLPESASALRAPLSRASAPIDRALPPDSAAPANVSVASRAQLEAQSLDVAALSTNVAAAGSSGLNHSRTRSDALPTPLPSGSLAVDSAELTSRHFGSSSKVCAAALRLVLTRTQCLRPSVEIAARQRCAALASYWVRATLCFVSLAR